MAPRQPPTPATERRRELLSYLHTLAGARAEPALLELRFRRPGGAMRQRFYAYPRRLAGLASTALWLAAEHDVYVGAAPRRERAGGQRAIERVHALWADCDTSKAGAALKRFDPAPALVVTSGSAGARHAYWPLAAPIAPEEAAALNRRLAVALGADRASSDAARILRPPGTLNHKHDPPAAVVLERLTGELFEPDQLARALPAEGPGTRHDRAPAGARHAREDDPLLALEPRLYVEALTGLEVGRDGKVSCPFHEDSTPSLHVYETPVGGWYCYGCGRGTSVYDLAAPLWGLETRGRDFIELRSRLYELLLPGEQPPGRRLLERAR